MGILVLERRKNQSIFVDVPDSNGKIKTIQFCFLDEDAGRIGIDAPREF